VSGIGLQDKQGKDELERHAPHHEPQVNTPAVLAHGPGDTGKDEEPRKAYEFLCNHESSILLPPVKIILTVYGVNPSFFSDCNRAGPLSPTRTCNSGL
jgi:hypothetical protein